ncbi:filamentous hemagglutinin N-terminal domain-containing protein [Pseudoduganella eburnea]|uniref:Filamentous hemagglutinin N-terminal domain-containing protein n=1 Tax=Massilia eburnea TaxID=1776165 RepID=A0A6L6QNX5_9BURK|nr:YDG domain-containing protein [Massilia eburnea]MTW13920.1 filamentous hemagglutinin N-terminal domain-containing protein [Massilia eburnea]
MNRIFRVVWNASLGMWQVRSELGGAYGKASTSRTARRALTAAGLALLGAAASAAELPKGGMVVAGQGTIAQSGSTMTINQGSAKLAIDWNSFSIGQGNTVNFVQPSSASVALNRVTGTDVSTIHGALKANGQVFLLNPNGVLFSPTAQINVGGLLASTLSMSNQDFMSGNYKLQGESTSAVINQGNIKAFNGGSVTLVAAHVSNVGEISADRGNILLGSGSEVLLDLGGPVKLQIQRGAVEALIENGGALRADGGTVLMTAKAAGDLLSTVINNSGVVQARTMTTGEQGQIILLGDMQNGRIDIAGKLDASAPQGGNGGFIETSAADVATARSVQIDASAAHGQGGHWLIDPYNYTIDANAASNIVGALNAGTSVTVTTQSSSSSYGSTGGGSGDITVASAISKSAGGDATLTLRADRNIAVNSDITSTLGKLGITLSAGNAAGATVGGVDVNANLKSNGGNIMIGGGNGTAVYGMAYALNSSNTTAAVVIERAKSILSTGGNIVINGKSLVGSNSGNYSGTTGGVYIMSDATLNSGNGNLFITGVSTGGSKTFGVAFEGASGTLTTVGNSAGGGMLLNAVNTTAGNTQAALDQGAIGMVSYGNRARIAFQGNSVASWLVFVNGAPQLSAYTQSPQLSSCASPYPNCGTLVIPGSNNSYLYATYQAVSMSTQPIYVIQNAAGSKTYDGNNTATGLTFSTLGGPNGFSVSSLAPAVAYTTSSKNAGYYVNLNADANNPTSYTSGGTSYSVGYFNTGSYTITPKTLTPIAANKVYDGTTAAAVSATGVIAGDSVSLSGNGAFASKDVGNYSVNISNIVLDGTDAANYALASTSASATASITARSVAIAASKTYDGATGMGGYVTFGNLVDGESLNYSGATANSANAGTASFINAITLQNGANGLASNYVLPSLASASAANTASITPKALTLTGLTASNKTYDGTTGATLNGGTLSGLVGAETLNLSGLTGAFVDKNAGSGKTVLVSGLALTSGTGLVSNYSISSPSAVTASITPRATSVSGITASDKTYDGTASAQLNTSNAAFSNLVSGDALSVSATGAFANANAGAGKAVNISSTYGGNESGNYTITDQSSTTASIARKALALTGLTASNKTYDGNTSAALSGGALSGLVGTETLNFSGLAGTFADKNAGTGKSVSVSGLTLADGTGLASNYSISSPSALTASITPRATTVSGITASDKAYDGSTSAQLNTGNALFSNLVDGDVLTISASGAFANANAGSAKTVSISSTYGGADAGNYAITSQASASATIARKALTLTGLAASDKTYDGNTSAALSGGTLNGLVGAETLNVSGLTGAFADKNVGTGKAVSVSGVALSDGTGLAANYSISNPTGLAASISPRATTVSGMTASDKTYDGNTTAQLNVANAVFSNLVDGDSLNVSAAGAFANANAGSGKTVNISSTYGGADLGNYAITGQASATASIARKALTLTGLVAADKTYDGNTSAALSGGSLNGLVGAETLNVSGLTGAFADKNAGAGKSVTVSGATLSDGSGLASNYSISNPGGLTASITPRATTVSGITAAGKTYDGATTAQVNTSHAVFSNLVDGDSVGLSAAGTFADANAGSAKTVNIASTYSGADVGNYAITDQSATTASIARKALTIVGMTANDKTYDASTGATVSGGSLSGLVGAETLNFSGQSAVFADRNAGNSKAVTVSGIGLADGTGLASNYELATPTGLTASILPKALAVSGVVAANKVEDGNTVAALTMHGSLAGVEAGDAVHIDGGSAAAQFAQSAPGTGIAVNVSGLALAGADAHNYSLAGTAATTANITSAPVPAPISAPVAVAVPEPVPVVAPAPVPNPVPVPEVASVPVSVPAPAPQVAPPPVIIQAPVPASIPVVTPPPAPVPAPAPAPIPVPEPVVAQVPLVTPAPAPAPVVLPSPAPDTRAAISAQVASPALQGGMTPALPSLSVGGLNYTDVSESSNVPANSANREHMPATQSLTAGRDVKFLSVFVVSGGIQMPAAATSNNTSTSEQK